MCSSDLPIDDIVQLAKVAKGSFYNHFHDKDHLVRALAAQIRQEIEQAIGAANAQIADPALRLVRGLCVYFDYASQKPNHAVALLRIQGVSFALDAPLNQGLVSDIAAGCEQGRFQLPSIEAGVLMAMGLAQIALAKITETAQASDPGDLARSLCKIGRAHV